MKRWSIAFVLLAALAPLIFSGCATTSKDGGPMAKGDKDVRQFAPDPQARAAAKDLRPVETRSVVSLLREADQAFQAASAAQGRGDRDAAQREYTRMLGLLRAADLDPAVFYSARKEFDALLREQDRHAHGGRRNFGRHEHPAKGQIGIPVPLPAEVIAQVERIQNDYPKSFQTALDKGQRYIPYIRQELKKAGLPEELVYVAMIESHFAEKIDSRSGAGGMWQFMPPTGRRFELRQDGFVDERYDWERSTKAAIEYLTILRDHFNGNWPLAIGAYNMGEGGMSRARAAAGGIDDFFTLIETPPASDMIKLETKQYYPKFLAYWLVASSPERYGFKINPPAHEPVFQTPIRGSYSLDDLDEALGLAPGTLVRHNPELVRRVTPPIGEHVLTVPQQAQARMADVLKSVPQYGQGVRSHKVKKGETITAIAARYGVSPEELLRHNQMRSNKGLRAGQTLKLPVGAAVAQGGPAKRDDLVAAVDAETRANTPAKTEVSFQTYTVKKGDSLGKIATAHKTTTKELQALNNMGKSHTVRIGETLKVGKTERVVTAKTTTPAPKAPAAATASDKKHTVKPGEYPATIARAYNVSVDDLLAWNKLTRASTIHAGQELIVRGAGPAVAASSEATPEEAPVKTASAPAPPAKSEPKKIVHKVAKGDTPGGIAAKYGVTTKDFLAWNNMSAKSLLKVGQECVVYSGGDKTTTASAAPARPERVLEARATDARNPETTASSQSAKSAKPITHVVSSGQNATSIARRYSVKVSDLYTWNNWQKNHVLQIGDKVHVKK